MLDWHERLRRCRCRRSRLPPFQQKLKREKAAGEQENSQENGSQKNFLLFFASFAAFSSGWNRTWIAESHANDSLRRKP